MRNSILSVVLLFFVSESLNAQLFSDYLNYGDLSLTTASQGVAAADYDNDGDLDIYLTAFRPFVQNDPDTWSRLYQNDGSGKFLDVTIAAGLAKQKTNVTPFDITVGITSGVSWGDYNNDGYVDLFLANDGQDFLYKNNGDGTFTDVTSQAGVAGCEKCYSASALWWDFDNDSDLDIYISDYRTKNRYYINNGDETFSESANEFGIDDEEESWAAMPLDFDSDGDWDFYVTNDNGPNRLFRNDNGFFTNVAEEFAVDDEGNGMGIGLVDYNNDGTYDIYVTNIHSNRPNPFYVGQRTETGTEDGRELEYNERANALGIDNTAWGWDMSFFDADHDLAVATYGSEDFNYFFSNLMNVGRDGFSDLSSQSGVRKPGGAFGLESFDFDTDGDIDLLFSSRNKSPILLENNTVKESNGKNWVQIYFIGTDSNRNGYGAEVYLTVNGKEYKSLYHGVGVGRQSLKPMHFGLDNFELIDKIRVVWPSGVVDNFEDLAVNLLYTVIEGEEIQSKQLIPSSSEEDIEFDLSKSIARVWNEELLEAIRNDFARPTVHARNLFHVSSAVYDAFSVYSNKQTYFLGNTLGDFTCSFDASFTKPDDKESAIRESISYAVYKIMSHRFADSPGASVTRQRLRLLMEELEYDTSLSSTDYASGEPYALGNYIGQCVIDFGLQDGSNEVNGYANEFYEPSNTPLDIFSPGAPDIENPNSWQPLTLEKFIDQSGNEIANTTPEFLSPEWGGVIPFSMGVNDYTVHQRDGNNYKVFKDPGPPPFLNVDQGGGMSDEYKWGFSLVSVWSAHLATDDNVSWDISPASLGNVNSIPRDFEDFRDFYDLIDGGDIGEGHSVNPATGLPYNENLVPRGDYARVLAEFWADGPDSETPPGHWFSILNYVSDNPDLVKRFEGQGRILSDLEWDILSYFTLGGTMHDAAISAWSIKGYYDYIRPISAIRYMAGQGQSSDPQKPSYSINGIPLIEGYIELVEQGDDLVGDNNENLNKIKLYAWRGPSNIINEQTDEAGVGWILADNWMPYQRPSFVTPPFAGYVSGHSTYSRAAAEVLTRFTGDAYFPGGMGEFVAPKDEFLVFEDGPSVDVVLQWATYRDASDQCSLSRIWGGIHPPADDLPGRLIGEEIGNNAYDYAKSYFEGIITSTESPLSEIEGINVYPNPLSNGIGTLNIQADANLRIISASLRDTNGRSLSVKRYDGVHSEVYKLTYPSLKPGIYLLNLSTSQGKAVKKLIVR